MPFLDAFKDFLGIPADSRTETIHVGDSSSVDGSAPSVSPLRGMLTTLGSVGGQKGPGQRVVGVIRNDKSGQVQSSASKSSSRHNGDAVSESFSDDEEGSSRRPRPLHFKVYDEVEVTDCEQYLRAVLNWRAEPFVSRNALMDSIQFGPHTLAELQEVVKVGADAAGFAIYAHKGARKSTKSCSIKFGCEHGRHRYGQEQRQIDSKSRDFNKDVDEIVRDNIGKRRKTRKDGGYRRAHTQRQRAKTKECNFSMCLTSCGDTWSPETSCFWKLNSDARCLNCYDHTNHARRSSKVRNSLEIKQWICDLGDRMLPSDLIQSVYSKFKVEVTSDQIKWILKKNSIKNLERARHSSRAGGAVDSIRYLLMKGVHDLVLLLLRCDTGDWFTAIPSLNTATPGCTVDVRLEPYDADTKSRPLSGKRDSSRELVIDGVEYVVWCCSYNNHNDRDLFSNYPHAVQMDCMHGITSSTDGFNAVGIDGNGNNIQIMRAYIGSQDKMIFTWIFSVAFPKLVPAHQRIRCFTLDGCRAMNSALRQACCPGQQFPDAGIFRCIFHFITKSFDDKFGVGDGWQGDVKQHLFSLRRCESQDEFDAKAEFVMRSLAEHLGLGEAQSTLRAKLLAFFQRRIDCSKLWVIMHQLNRPTRGCSATARVEGTHGRDRRDDRINARNSWLCTTKRYCDRLSRRHRARQAWARRQVGSKLLRTPINPAMSSFKGHHIAQLDRLLNPWALETFEEQGLLAQTANVVFKKKGKTKESKSYGHTKHVAGEFACWYSDDGESDNGDTEYSENENPGSDYSDSSSSSTSTSDDGDSSSSDSPPRNRRRSSSSDSKVPGAMDESDSESDEDTVHGGTKFNPIEFVDRCSKRPLGRVKFKWAKVRTVTVAPQYDDAQKYTGQYVVICSCGFPVRIGVVCRHILAVLTFMLFSCKKKFGDSDCQLDDYNSDEEMNVDHAVIDWDKVPLIDLCNPDIVSKIKYHAALHNKGHLFKLSDKLFRSRIPEDAAGVRKHPETF